MYELDDEDSQDNLDAPNQHKRDEAVRKELDKVRQRGFDPIRDGGLSSSSDDSSSEDEEEEEEVEDQAELAAQGNEVPMGDITSRIAAVNMDWDNIRASDIMAVANSFAPADGRIHSVIIYPSEFGIERLQREEMEGPPREIFASSAKNKKKNVTTIGSLNEEPGSEDEEELKEELANENMGEDFDSKALRTYQLDRLRYYYAVITCSSPDVARAIYESMDGREYLSSANFFDLRFIPDGVEFDADPHDECERLPDGYKPNEFITDALSHSKVKLTWDAEDTTRKEVQKRAFSRKEIDENELKAYLGTDSSSSEDEAEASKADRVASFRAALGLEPAGKSQPKQKLSHKRDRDFKKPDDEMQITFTAGLSANGGKSSVFENEPEENTLEKYIRKQKERRARRKEKAVAMKEGNDPDAVSVCKSATKTNAHEEDPWNDPFFGSDTEAADATKAESKKSRKAKQREEREKQEQESAAERAKLELLMVDDEGSKVQHFDMNEILKAEKAKKKGKKSKKAKDAVLEDNFQMDTNDPRFAKLYENHEFAIDPTNPRFKGTSGMKALLEEGRKKRKRDRDEDDLGQVKASKRVASDGDDLRKLAARVKAKSKRP